MLSRIPLIDKNAFWIKSVALDRQIFIPAHNVSCVTSDVWRMMYVVWSHIWAKKTSNFKLFLKEIWHSGFRFSPKFGAEFGNYTGKPRFRMKIRRQGLMMILRICTDHDICNPWNSNSEFRVKNSNLSQFPFNSEIVGRSIKLHFENLKYFVIFSIEIITMTPETKTKKRICTEMIWQHFVTYCETCKIAYIFSQRGGCVAVDESISWERCLCWHKR